MATTGRGLFLEGLKREKRYPEFLARKSDYVREGLTKTAAETRALREMGYRGRGSELALLPGEVDFDEALAGLPDTSHPGKELEWVRAHPAMGRLARSRDKTADIQITLEDILDAPHGMAPSKGAVSMLQHWANRPQKFWEQLLSEDKKQISKEGPLDTLDPEEDLEKVERLLRQVSASEVNYTSFYHGGCSDGRSIDSG